MARKPTNTIHLKLRFDERLRRRIERPLSEQSVDECRDHRSARTLVRERGTAKLIKQVAETTVLYHIQKIRSVIKRAVKISGPQRAEVLVSVLGRSGYNKAELQTLLPIFEKEGLIRMSSADRKAPTQSQGKSTTQDVEANERVTEMPTQTQKQAGQAGGGRREEIDPAHHHAARW